MSKVDKIIEKEALKAMNQEEENKKDLQERMAKFSAEFNGIVVKYEINLTAQQKIGEMMIAIPIQMVDIKKYPNTASEVVKIVK